MNKPPPIRNPPGRSNLYIWICFLLFNNLHLIPFAHSQFNCPFQGARGVVGIEQFDDVADEAEVWSGSVLFSYGNVSSVNIIGELPEKILRDEELVWNDTVTQVRLSAKPEFRDVLDFTGEGTHRAAGQLVIQYIGGSNASCEIDIIIKDRNTQAPEFNRSNDDQSITFRIKRSWDTSVALNWRVDDQLKVTDYDDLSENAVVVITPDDGGVIRGDATPVADPELYPNRHVFDVQLYLDRVEYGNFLIHASDAVHDTPFEVIILEEKENLHFPQFLDTKYYLELNEMPAVGLPVPGLKISAEDKDGDEFTLKVVGDAADYLDVTTPGGELFFTREVRELKGQTVNVEITATEDDNEDNSTPVTLTIKFPRREDPKFTETFYHDMKKSWEETKQGEIIAEDLKLEPYPDWVGVEFESENLPSFIDLNPVTGELTFNKDVMENDKEELGKNRVRVFEVKATVSNGGEVREAVTTVVVGFPMDSDGGTTTEAGSTTDAGTTPGQCTCPECPGTTDSAGTTPDSTATPPGCPEPPECPSTPSDSTATPPGCSECPSTEPPECPSTIPDSTATPPGCPEPPECPSTPSDSTATPPGCSECPSTEPPECPSTPPDSSSTPCDCSECNTETPATQSSTECPTTSDPGESTQPSESTPKECIECPVTDCSTDNPPTTLMIPTDNPPECPPGCTTEPPTSCPDPPPCTTTQDPNCPPPSTCEPCDSGEVTDRACPPCNEDDDDEDCSAGGLIAATVVTSVLFVASLGAAGYLFWVIRRASINPFSFAQSTPPATKGTEADISSSFMSPKHVPSPAQPPTFSSLDPLPNGFGGNNGTLPSKRLSLFGEDDPSLGNSFEPTDTGVSNPTFNAEEASAQVIPPTSTSPSSPLVTSAAPILTPTSAPPPAKKSNLKNPKEIEPDYEDFPVTSKTAQPSATTPAPTKTGDQPRSRKASRVLFAPEAENEYISIDDNNTEADKKGKERGSDSEGEYERL